jgi:hypothetical protein
LVGNIWKLASIREGRVAETPINGSVQSAAATAFLVVPDIGDGRACKRDELLVKLSDRREM